MLLELYTYPAEHWVHLRTTNPSPPSPPFGCGIIPKGQVPAPLAWRWRSSSSSQPQQRWRAVNAPHLVPLVRAGAPFEKGKLVERPDDHGGEQQVA